MQRLEALQSDMRVAQQRSDWPGYRAAVSQLARLLNGSRQSLLEQALAQSYSGDAPAALAALLAYAAMGQSSALVDSAPDFASLRKAPGFPRVRAQPAVNGRPIARSTLAFRIPAAGLLPEDIDYDPDTRRFCISNILQHRIVLPAADGQITAFARGLDDRPMLALKFDSARRWLWVIEVALERCELIPKTEQGRSAVLCYDIDSGQLLRRIEAPRPTALGDMALNGEGGVIVTDGDHGGVYRLRLNGTVLERLDKGDFISPQTVALGFDHDHLIVPD